MNLDELESYDLRAAIENNAVPVPDDFDVLAEVLSEAHDEGEYFWIIRDKETKQFYCIDGAHDYTGWDCQSNARISKPFSSLDEMHLHVQVIDNQNRPVREMLRGQAEKWLKEHA